MPELPDVTVYVEALAARLHGAVLEGIELRNPFLLRSVEPAPAELVGRRVVGVERLGKRVVIALEGDVFVVIHLMIAGRLHWRGAVAAASADSGGTGGAVGASGRTSVRVAKPKRMGTPLLVLRFDRGDVTLTEAGTKRRASLHLVHGREALRAFDRGGIEPLSVSAPEFVARLRSENHTLKRALTDPRLFSGIGNAYSDEVLHRARLSPMTLTSRLPDDDAWRLHVATVDVMNEWIARLRAEAGAEFPEKVTAFRPEMAVHGRYGMPCPVCGTAVQRIRYADNETNYCPRCQTGGHVLADRALSRLLKDDWPRTIEQLEEGRGPRGVRE
jgi:formamidopyrimidine-DNA glycosylase